MMYGNLTEYYRHSPAEYLSSYINQKAKLSFEGKLGLAVILVIILFIISVTINTPLNAKPIETGQVENIYTQENFKAQMEAKYKNNYVFYPAKGIAHIKQVKYINSKPIKVNIVEINTKVNPNLDIKPQIAGETLKSKTTVKRMAQKENAVVALNGGYFKPQTGTPLGALIINKKMLTGPIYNRVGIGIFEDNGQISYAMDNIAFDITASNLEQKIQIDNINQPRMSQGTTLIYTSDWDTISPPPPKNGYNLLIQDNNVIKMSANPIPIAKNQYVISSSKEKILNIAKNKKVHIDFKVKGKMQSAKHIIGAGPYLIKEGKINVDVKAEKLEAITGKNPRTAIGYTQEGNLILVTIDGRESTSVGMTLNELASLMLKLNCYYAMNFDGGSSSTMVINGKVANDAPNKTGIPVSNALIISQKATDTLQISSL